MGSSFPYSLSSALKIEDQGSNGGSAMAGASTSHLHFASFLRVAFGVAKVATRRNTVTDAEIFDLGLTGSMSLFQ